MQRKSRGVLLALIAVFAMSAVTAAAASATTPEFKPVPAKKKFTATSGTVRMEFWGTDESLECTKSSTTGEITGARTVGKVVIIYTGCKALYLNSESESCPTNSQGAKMGEIVTDTLSGELGTVAKSEAASEVGLRLKPTEKKVWFLQAGNPCVEEAYIERTLAAQVARLGKSTTHGLAFETVPYGAKIKEITLDSGLVEKPELVADLGSVGVAASDNVTFEEAVEVT